jgi:hypothetical protein
LPQLSGQSTIIFAAKIAFDLRPSSGYCPRVMNAAQPANLALLLLLEQPTVGCVCV